MAATEGTSSGAVRYRSGIAVRRWIHRCLLVVLAGLCVMAGAAGNLLAALAGLAAIGALAAAYHRTVVELVLDGDRLTLVSGTGRRTTVDLDQLERIDAPTSFRGARLRTVGGSSRPLQVTGALLPLLDLIDERRPGAVDAVRPVAEKASRVEEKQAARRDRFPWLTPVAVACTVVGLLLLAGWMTVIVLERNTILDRAEAVEATVLGVDGADGEERVVTVEHRWDGEVHRAEITVEPAERAEPGGSLVIAVDPEDPDLAWAIGDRPAPPIRWEVVVVAGILLCAGILLAPTALARHPTLTAAGPAAG